ncbi:hypothetical protein HS088_TW07G00193 [Tripterygium wilfordii]|uniref:Uncharacterized protein n=2 Tax=Tripterygium wilfordii TaxID=458696 RepID=A0A7J7DEC8_TRIWF|nr:hypothetical protein HS088_TW07G00193 [Tripterygium wilfordii]
MRLHNLAGPPRFLFTIKEETKEDLESEDGKSRGDCKSRKSSRTRSLSDLILAVDTPYVSPLASPPFKAPLDSYFHHGFNPLFESTTEAELNRLRSSPPPKFKFMRDAEEKLQRKFMEEAERKKSENVLCAQDSQVESLNSTMVTEGIQGSFLNFLVSSSKKEKELLHHLPQYPSSTAQVLPLASSPTAF